MSLVSRNRVPSRRATEKPEQRPHEQAMHRLGALAAGAPLERLEIDVAQGHGAHAASETAASPFSELTIATPRWRSL